MGQQIFDILKKAGYLFTVILILLTTAAAAENSNSVDTSADQDLLNKITFDNGSISGNTINDVSLENVDFNNVIFNNVTFINVSINNLNVTNLTVNNGQDAKSAVDTTKVIRTLSEAKRSGHSNTNTACTSKSGSTVVGSTAAVSAHREVPQQGVPTENSGDYAGSRSYNGTDAGNTVNNGTYAGSNL